MRRDVRASLLAKCIAIFLLVVSTSGAAAGTAAVVSFSAGYGTAATYYEDPLFLEQLKSGIRQAGSLVVYNDSSYYVTERYPELSVQVYDGEPSEETLVGTWSTVPQDYILRYEIVDYDSSAVSGYYTYVGYLDTDPAFNSLLFRNQTVYDLLQLMRFDGIGFVTFLCYLAAMAALVFLLCAAGHRRGREGIVSNWQDRIPLDLYLFCASCAVCAAVALGGHLALEEFSYSGFSLYLQLGAICFLLAGILVLAFLMTLATRLKLGGWWRNTICYMCLRWCGRLSRKVWRGVVEFTRILPLTWRTVLLVGSVLVAQVFLTLLMFESYDGGFFFLVTVLFDGALVVGSAWLTRQVQQVRDMGRALAAGDLDAKLDTRKLYRDVRDHAEDLNAISEGMNRAVEQRLKSERLKTELITNVSHDIKTPLTSIVNYVDLLKKEELPPTAAEYLAVLDRQSNRLRKLTEDLVEASKASTGNVSVKLEPIVVNEIVHQAIGDYDEKLSAGRLEVIVNSYEGNLRAMADGRLLWRVLDNLLSNVCKYALAGTRVYIDLTGKDGRVALSVKNISRDQLNVSADELMERFVRGDASRHTEGSGLGLNIARSLMDLMGGTFSLSVDGDLFKAELSLPGADAGPTLVLDPVPAAPDLPTAEDIAQTIEEKKRRLADLAAELAGKLRPGGK